ncbi:MAG: hypothetical protein KF863_10695 [Rubrivivax sp.]|nr:hypothetical protein [Rubrivivax sp.]
MTTSHATDTAGTTATLTQVAHAQTNELYDAVALLHAIEERVDDLALPKNAPDEVKERQHQTLRLAQMARAKVEATIAALDPHI